MSPTPGSSKYLRLKQDFTTAREQLSVALDRYAELCLNIRNTHHQAAFRDVQTIGLPWSEIDPELAFISSLKTRLQEATQNLNRAYEIGRAKSISVYPPLIDRLPDEILTQVFRLAVGIQLRDHRLSCGEGVAFFPRYPDVIAQICARWRKISLMCSSLWTRIYMAPHLTCFSSLLSHAKSYAQRAGQLPLEVYLTDGKGQGDLDPGFGGVDLQEFVASIAPRTKSLEVLRSNSSISEIERKGLIGILQGCSKIFTRLVVRLEDRLFPEFMDAFELIELIETQNGVGLASTNTPINLEQIECSFAYLTDLHVSHLYPPWTSTAYHGLVDLRLMTNHNYAYAEECPCIDSAQFTAILTASPSLRILHFGINLEYDGNDVSEIYTSVQLNDLEVLYLAASHAYGPGDTEYEIQRVMQHITPGPKPLHLTLDVVCYRESEPLRVMKSFFSKSNIVSFCSRKGAPPPIELVNCAPNLNRLIFDRCHYNAVYDFYQTRSSIIRLDSWTIQGSSIYVEDLELLVRQYTVQSVKLVNCRLYDKSSSPGEIEGYTLETWLHFQKPAHVQYLEQNLSIDLTADWE